MRRPPTVRAHDVRDALSRVDPDTVILVEDWLRSRPDQPDPSWPAAEVRAAAWLDRVASRDLPPVQRRAMLQQAQDSARALDPVLTEHLAAELAVLDVAAGDREGTQRAITHARDLESQGALFEAAEVWRSIARYAAEPGSEQAAEAALAAAELSGRAGESLRHALALVEAATQLAEADPGRAADLLATARSLAPRHSVIESMADEVAARVALRAGDLDTAAARLAESATRTGAPVAVALGHLMELCAVHLARADWAALGASAASALAHGVDGEVPVVVDLAHGYLGIAQGMTSETARAVTVLEECLPALERQGLPLAGPVAAVLGDLRSASGDLDAAAAAHERAAAAYVRHGYAAQAADALLVAAELAALAEDGDAAHRLSLAAQEAFEALGDVDGWVEATRAGAVARVSADTADACVAELDGIIERARDLAAEKGQPAPDEVELRLQLLCQGAQVLVAVDRLPDALGRLAQGEQDAASEGQAAMAWLLRTERGLILADADLLHEAEPVVRPAVRELADLGEHAAAAQAADVLAQALERAARQAEAATLRSRYPAPQN